MTCILIIFLGIHNYVINCYNSLNSLSKGHMYTGLEGYYDSLSYLPNR